MNDQQNGHNKIYSKRLKVSVRFVWTWEQTFQWNDSCSELLNGIMHRNFKVYINTRCAPLSSFTLRGIGHLRTCQNTYVLLCMYKTTKASNSVVPK